MNVTSGVCSAEMVQQLANASVNVDVSINDLKSYVAHAQRAVRDTFRNKSVVLASVLRCFPGRRSQPYLTLWMKQLAMRLRPCRVMLLIVNRLCENAWSGWLVNLVRKVALVRWVVLPQR